MIVLVVFGVTACDSGVSDETVPDEPEETYTISGQVVDFEGDPVDDVTIVISEEESVTPNGENGSWQATGLSGETEIKLAEDGLPENYTVSGEEKGLDFVKADLPDAKANTENIRDKMEKITSEEYNGRLAGLTGAVKTEEFISNNFEEYGLGKLPELNSFEQEFEHYIYYPNEGANSLLEVVNDENDLIHDFEPLKDFIPRNSFAPVSLNKEIDSAEIHLYEGYINDEHKKGVLLVPGHEAFGANMIQSNDDKAQVETAKVDEKYPIQGILDDASDNGVAAVIISSNQPENHNYLTRTVMVDSSHDCHDYKDEHSAVFSADPKTFEKLEQASEDGNFVNMEIDYEFEEVISNNIVGYIEGESEETLIIGAHFDHAGFGYDGDSEKVIYPGALDNASGTVSMMKLAKYASEFGTPEKNIAFVGFNAEELGLKGSNYFVNELSSTEKIQYINLDMIDEPIGLYNQEDDEATLLAKLDRIIFDGMDIEGESVEGVVGSDNLSFSEDPDVDYKDVMALYKPDLDEVIHTPADNMEAVNIDNITKIVDGLLIYLYNLAY